MSFGTLPEVNRVHVIEGKGVVSVVLVERLNRELLAKSE